MVRSEHSWTFLNKKALFDEYKVYLKYSLKAITGDDGRSLLFIILHKKARPTAPPQKDFIEST